MYIYIYQLCPRRPNPNQFAPGFSCCWCSCCVPVSGLISKRFRNEFEMLSRPWGNFDVLDLLLGALGLLWGGIGLLLNALGLLLDCSWVVLGWS